MLSNTSVFQDLKRIRDAVCEEKLRALFEQQENIRGGGGQNPEAAVDPMAALALDQPIPEAAVNQRLRSTKGQGSSAVRCKRRKTARAQMPAYVEIEVPMDGGLYWKPLVLVNRIPNEAIAVECTSHNLQQLGALVKFEKEGQDEEPPQPEAASSPRKRKARETLQFDVQGTRVSVKMHFRRLIQNPRRNNNKAVEWKSHGRGQSQIPPSRTV